VVVVVVVVVVAVEVGAGLVVVLVVVLEVVVDCAAARLLENAGFFGSGTTFGFGMTSAGARFASGAGDA